MEIDILRPDVRTTLVLIEYSASYITSNFVTLHQEQSILFSIIYVNRFLSSPYLDMICFLYDSLPHPESFLYNLRRHYLVGGEYNYVSSAEHLHHM
jgi:hypothetical protein